MSNQLTIALLQHVSTPNNLEASLKRMEDNARLAASDGTNLILFPEASLTGYNNSKEQTDAIAQNASGPSFERIARIAQDNSIAIAYGFAERDGDAVYNSVQMIDENGDAALLYRKSHLWGDQDRRLFSAGDAQSKLIDFHGWSLGFLICYDIEFPENVRHLALAGAELILTPTALMSPWTTVADKVLPVRAYENQVFIAYANFCGAEHEQQYVGHSCIVDPAGENMAKASTNEALLIAQLDKSSIADMRAALPYHHDRRPELYSALTKE